jgi:hypothetical protein
LKKYPKEKKMKKMVSVGIVAIMAALFAATPALAFEGSADAYVGVYNDYVWRGFNLTGTDSDGDDNDFVIQGGADVSFDNFTVSYWFNATEDMDVNEVDIVLDYSFDINEMVSMSVGNILYEVEGEVTNEVYLGVGLGTILEPSLTYYYDYDEFAGTSFVTASVGHSFDLTEQASLSLGGLVSYADDGEDYNAMHNGELSAGLDFAVTENITLSASALFSTPISDEAEDDAGLDDEAVVGLSVAAAF